MFVAASYISFVPAQAQKLIHVEKIIVDVFDAYG